MRRLCDEYDRVHTDEEVDLLCAKVAEQIAQAESEHTRLLAAWNVFLAAEYQFRDTSVLNLVHLIALLDKLGHSKHMIGQFLASMHLAEQRGFIKATDSLQDICLGLARGLATLRETMGCPRAPR